LARRRPHPGQEYAATVIVAQRAAGHAGGVRQRDHAQRRPTAPTVRVKDIARVELGAEDYNIFARVDGQPTAAIAVRVAPGGNALDSGQGGEGARSTELAKYFPQEHFLGWCPTTPRPSSTSRSREVVKTLIEAMILVVLVMYLFLENLRATFIPTVVVPVSLIGA
jgi:multidrug efflux pump subunit AcrB